MPSTTQASQFDRRLNAALAGLTLAFILFALVTDILGLDAAFPGEVTFGLKEWSTWEVRIFGAAIIVTVASLFLFWGRMLADFFAHRPARHPVRWGWALVLLNCAAALVYYWYVWRPRNAESSAAAA